MIEIPQAIQDLSAEQGLAQIARLYPDGVSFSTSLGWEDQVITDMICRNALPIRLFTLDTGRLFEETYDLYDRTIRKYGVPIQVYYPDAEEVSDFVTQKGMNSFYDSVENRKACCHIRKVRPLQSALRGVKVWVTGLRAGQSDARKALPKLEWDPANQVIKYHPLLDWEQKDLALYVKDHQVPYNPLHDKGYISIGCAPCTRAVLPGEDPRAGRWWWESSHKECGLHAPTPASDLSKN